jgi:hypothetical protein
MSKSRKPEKRKKRMKSIMKNFKRIQKNNEIIKKISLINNEK